MQMGRREPLTAVEQGRQYDACEGWRDNPQAAVVACTAAIDSPDEPAANRIAALINRGNARYALGQPDLAVADFDRAIELLSADSGGFDATDLFLPPRGGALGLDVINAMAAGALQASGSVDGSFMAPHKAAALANRGYTRLAQGHVAPALEDFNAVVALGLADAAVFHARAQARLMAGNPEAALTDADEALRLSPGDKEARKTRTRICLKLGNAQTMRADPDAERDDDDARQIARRRGWLLGLFVAVVLVLLGWLALH